MTEGLLRHLAGDRRKYEKIHWSLEDPATAVGTDEEKKIGLYGPNSVKEVKKDEFSAHLDLILCRNVVIYFTKPLQEMVYSSFGRALNGGGFPVLGKVELGNRCGDTRKNSLRFLTTEKEFYQD